MSTERNRAASPRSRGVGGSRCCGRPRSGRRIHESRCAHRKTTRRREDGSRPESTGIRTEREALRVDSPGWRRRILDRGKRASDSCRRWRGPADKGRRKESEEHGGRWGAVCSVTIDFRRSPSNPLYNFFDTNPLNFSLLHKPSQLYSGVLSLEITVPCYKIGLQNFVSSFKLSFSLF